MIFVLIALFSGSGAFSGVSYTDILGKSIKQESRKKFLSINQISKSLTFLLSAFIVRIILKILIFLQIIRYYFCLQEFCYLLHR